MMESFYIAGDWGSSHLRLSLLDAASGAAVAQADGPGIQSVSKDSLPGVFASLTQDWRKLHPSMPIILCGMVGADIGWVDAGYMQCPLKLSQLCQHLAQVQSETGPVTIIPGISCRNPIGAADMLRGEETQMLGALAQHPDLCQGQHLLCLPGTHSKWVWLEDGTVQHFITSISGELYALLGQHSMLVKNCAPTVVVENRAFADGVARSAAHPYVDLLQLLFETRSRQLSGMLAPIDAGSFMSGLLIGRDIHSATALFQNAWHGRQSIIYIGEHTLTAAYLAAAKQSGLSGESMDGDAMSRAGIHEVYLSIRNGIQHHAN